MKSWQFALGKISGNGENWVNLKVIKELNVCDTHTLYVMSFGILLEMYNWGNCQVEKQKSTIN